jgi:hypothetical protein
MKPPPVIVYEPISRQTENLVGLFFLIHARSLSRTLVAHPPCELRSLSREW